MFDFKPEDLASVPHAVEKATRRRISPTTCWRWTKRGVKGIVLETIVVGDRVLTTDAAVRRFIESTTKMRRGN